MENKSVSVFFVQIAYTDFFFFAVKEVAVLRPFNSEGTCALRLFNQYSLKDVCKAGCLNHLGCLLEMQIPGPGLWEILTY